MRHKHGDTYKFSPPALLQLAWVGDFTLVVITWASVIGLVLFDNFRIDLQSPSVLAQQPISQIWLTVNQKALNITKLHTLGFQAFKAAL